MTSKAERLKRKRQIRLGRPRKDGVARTESGRISRSAQQKMRSERESVREARETVVKRRMRQFGITEAQASNRLWGFPLGALYAGGRITKEEFDAGQAYCADMVAYYGLTGIPFPTVRAQDIFRVAGYSGEISTEQARRARVASNRYMALQGLLLSSGRNGRQVMETVNKVCFLDYDITHWPNHMIALLRKGLKVLAKEGLTR